MESRQHRATALVGGAAVALVGLVLLGFSIDHLRTEAHEPVLIVLGGLLPVLLSAATTVAGVLLTQSTLAPRYVRRILGWWLVGMFVAALMEGTIVIYQFSHGVVLADAPYVLTNTVAAGSTGALLIGYFDARRHVRTDQLTAEREQFEVLNRVVRHDIQNDMNVVIGWLQILEPHVDDEGRDAFDRVERTSDHVVELTHIARDYVGFLSGDADHTLEPIPLESTIRTVCETRQAAYPRADIDLGDVPDVAVPATEMLASVFRNLVNNAVQHNDADTPHVEVTAERHGDSVSVSVADNGPGIPDAQKDRIFGKGEQSLDSPGTGIGLYLVDSLVREFGGTVDVADNDPRGTVFTVDLPIAEET